MSLSICQRKVYTTPLLAEAKTVATQNSLPKRNDVAKEAVSAARQTKTSNKAKDISNQTISNDQAATVCKNHVQAEPLCGGKFLGRHCCIQFPVCPCREESWRENVFGRNSAQLFTLNKGKSHGAQKQCTVIETAVRMRDDMMELCRSEFVVSPKPPSLLCSSCGGILVCQEIWLPGGMRLRIRPPPNASSRGDPALPMNGGR